SSTVERAAVDRPCAPARCRSAHVFGVRRELTARIHREGNAVKPWMESHLPDPDVKRSTALDLRDRAGGSTGIGQRSATRSRLLWIAVLRFLKPRCRFEQPEMCAGARRKDRQH